MVYYQVRKRDFTYAFGTGGLKVIQDVPPQKTFTHEMIIKSVIMNIEFMFKI